ncbi:MAG TPA: DUF2130 domain-containing protein [Stellaceae bacterium]|nr:DUF2130 domain-containing protein [Stellaceae bacterium]
MSVTGTSPPNGHDSHPTLGTAGTHCPVCDSPISARKFAEIEGVRRAREAEIEQSVEARFAKQLAETERRKKAEIAAAVKLATKVVEAKLKAIRDSQAGIVAAAVAAEREKAGKLVVAAVAAAKVEHATEKARLEADLSLLQKKLVARPAHQIGGPAEVDLYDTLVSAFPGDRISRVAKGVKGPDVVMDVVTPNGDIAGRVILDSKAHARWSSKFATKLRGDQLAAQADFAILVSSAFPAGARELHMQDSVLIVSPARAVVVVQFLRQQVIFNYRLKLSAEARDEKGDRLLAYLTSDAGFECLGAVAKATDDMINLEARQLDAETGFHRRRGEMIRAIQRAHEELVAQIDGIVSGNELVSLEPAI